MQSNYEKKSFELFDKLDIYEKYKVMMSEKSVVNTRTLRSRLSTEEEQQFWQILDDSKKFAQNLKELLLLSLLRKDVMQDILKLHLKLVEDQPFRKTDDELLEIVSQIKDSGAELDKLNNQMLELIEETESLQQSLHRLNYPIAFTPEMNPEKIRIQAELFKGLTDIENPQVFIQQARALEVREMVQGNELRENFINQINKWLEVI
ncbi:MAG: hypothetical protein WC536_01450 [Patescibacteria group bacterium]